MDHSVWSFLTYWTISHLFLFPPSLQTVKDTEAVAACQKNRICKDVLADRAAEICLWLWSYFLPEGGWKYSQRCVKSEPESISCQHIPSTSNFDESTFSISFHWCFLLLSHPCTLLCFTYMCELQWYLNYTISLLDLTKCMSVNFPAPTGDSRPHQSQTRTTTMVSKPNPICSYCICGCIY